MTSPSDDSTPLHKAIEDNDLEGFESLLRNPNTDINAQNHCGQTPLLVSLIDPQLASFTMRLIQAGSDLNISDNVKTTPLHRAMLWSLNEIAHELIKRGADINAQGKPLLFYASTSTRRSKEYTPLHGAVTFNNLAGVCMLLYYGADVSRNFTPFKHAAKINHQDMVKVLINYYDESYYSKRTKRNGSNAHPLEHEGTVLFAYSYENGNTKLAKWLWDKINFESILDEQDSNFLLETYIRDSCFATSDWLKYLFLIFQVFLTRQFTITYKFDLRFRYPPSYFSYLLNGLLKKNIEPATRLRIIYLSLSLGAPIRIDDLKKAHKLYGFGEELEALIYSSSRNTAITNGPGPNAITSNALGLEDFSHIPVFHLFKGFLNYEMRSDAVYSTTSTTVDYVVALLGLFSLPSEGKQEIKNVCLSFAPDEQKRIFEELDQIPECPTLVELSRNEARKYIRQTNLIKHPYHFHDVIKKLNIPQRIKDLIRFKTPLH